MQQSINSFFKSTREYLIDNCIPHCDGLQISNEMNEFESGGHYGIEISSMNNLKILEKALNLADEMDVKINRVIECRGIIRLPDQEIRDMVNLCYSRGIGLVMSVGPRAISDIGSFSASPNGKRMGYRLRGMENIIHGVEDVIRAVDLGVRGFTIYDEGLLYLLNDMRKNNKLPSDVIFKFSVHSGCSNPMSAKVLENIGIDSINVIPDLEVSMLASFRPYIKCPIDVFSDTSKAAAGLLRTYDVPKMIKACSPVYLKCGPISQPEQNHLPSEDQIVERIKQTRNVVECIDRYLPEAKVVSASEKTLAIPVPNSIADIEVNNHSIQVQ